MNAKIDYAHLHLTESLWGRDGLRKGYCTCGWTTSLTEGDVVRTLVEIHLREAKELKVRNGGKGFKLKTFTIESKDKKDYFICTVEPDQLKLEYEVYGNGPGSADVETFYTIPKSEYTKIAAKFGKTSSDEIADVLKYIEECDRIGEFQKDIVDGVIEVSDKFAWWHFDDDDEDLPKRVIEPISTYREPRSGDILYKQGDEAVIIFDQFDGKDIWAHIRREGVEYKSKLLFGMLKFGYWEEVGHFLMPTEVTIVYGGENK